MSEGGGEEEQGKLISSVLAIGTFLNNLLTIVGI